jgi:cyclopropane-fatty-acyl-phospholipid synthase
MGSRNFIQTILAEVDIRINGNRSWDVQIHNDRFYDRVVRQGTLGLGESYMDGWWDCEALDVMFHRLLQSKADTRFRFTLPVLVNKVLYWLFNLQSLRRGTQVAERHYNFGNTLFSHMLGPSLVYSCGYWRQADNLDAAQTDKMDLICRKLKLEPGLKVMDIGSGWGSLAIHMAAKYRADVSATTISTEQYEYARKLSSDPPVRWMLDDYSTLDGTYDRVVSVGMFEHVGHKNYATFMNTVRRILKRDGLFLLHTIGCNVGKKGLEPWMAKYIFPNGMLPSIASIGKAVASRFVMEDWQNFGAYYDKTLMAWKERFEDGFTQGLFTCSKRARRMFRYYLLSCAGAFRARDIQVWQIVLSPQGVPGGYIADS